MDGVELLRRFLDEQNWPAALDIATALIDSAQLTTGDRALCYYAQCQSLQGLERFAAAIAPGHRAVALSTEAGDIDLAGRALLQLGFLQFMQKRYADAADTWTEYLRNASRYTHPDLQRRTAEVTFNLGTAYHALGDHVRALDTFLQSWELARSEQNDALAETARSNAVWDALILKRTDVARRLMGHGERFVREHPDDTFAATMHLLDQAKCAWVEGDVSTATARAMEAAVYAGRFPALMAQAFQILLDVAVTKKEYAAAAAFGLCALERAQEAERHDLAVEIQGAINRLYLRAPGEVLQVVGEMISPQAGSGDNHGSRRTLK